jgi:hypothetical protein
MTGAAPSMLAIFQRRAISNISDSELVVQSARPVWAHTRLSSMLCGRARCIIAGRNVEHACSDVLRLRAILAANVLTDH